MNRHFVISLFFVLPILTSFCSCSSPNEKKTDFHNGNELITQKPKEEKYLIIQDSPVIVYTKPDGKEFAELDAGHKCKIILQGEFTRQNGIFDYWYKIGFDGKEAWVFGAYTSVRQNTEFEVFLREFNKSNKGILSMHFSNVFLNGQTGFIPLEYKRVSATHYAAIFYNNQQLNNVELLLAIYKSDKLLNLFSIFKGNIKNCTSPKAFFTSKNFIKFIGPSCQGAVAKVKYLQILENSDIKELKSSITAETPDGILPKIKAYASTINGLLSDDCNCLVSSTVQKAHTNQELIFYNVKREECGTICISTNNSLIAMQDNNSWIIKFEEKGAFKAIYESGIADNYIVVLEEIHQKHLLVKKMVERIYLLDAKNQSMKELNLKAESCIIMSPTQYGCDFCKDNTTHKEELMFVGKPVVEVVKKISSEQYDNLDNCEPKGKNSLTIKFSWNARQKVFIQQAVH